MANEVIDKKAFLKMLENTLRDLRIERMALDAKIDFVQNLKTKIEIDKW